MTTAVLTGEILRQQLEYVGDSKFEKTFFNKLSDMGNFKNLRVWQEGIELAEYIYKITNRGLFSKDYGLSNQIQRAVVSISSNLAEGEERQSNKEAVYFFNVAKGSAAEVITQLHIAHRIGYIDKKALDYLENKTEKIRATIKNLIKSKGGNKPINLIIWPILSLLGL